uniref:HMG box domain-containing protein n=1 Tax=Panagrolaimus davidi TaxID=227884 RepID=A0A914PI62_9BILA
MFNKGFRFTNLLLNEIKSIKSSAINPTTKSFPTNYISPTTFAIYIQENIKKTPLTKSEFSRLSTEWKQLSNEEKERFETVQKMNQCPEQPQQLEEEHHKKRIQIILFEFFEKTDYPNCPLSIFDVYRRSIEPGTFSLDEIKEHFEELTDEEMQIYMDKFTQEMTEYHQAVKKWRQTHGHKFNVLKKKLHFNHHH